MDKLIIAVSFLSGLVASELVDDLQDRLVHQIIERADEADNFSKSPITEVQPSSALIARMDYHEHLIMNSCNDRERMKIDLKLIKRSERDSCYLPENPFIGR